VDPRVAGLVSPAQQDKRAQSLHGRHVLMKRADHASVISDRNHAAELAPRLLDFAETICRTPSVGSGRPVPPAPCRE